MKISTSHRGYAFKMGEEGLGYYHDELLGAEVTVLHCCVDLYWVNDMNDWCAG